ncbi:hypothetical protein CR513_63117, partial [Mucuna pruriens]
MVNQCIDMFFETTLTNLIYGKPKTLHPLDHYEKVELSTINKFLIDHSNDGRDGCNDGAISYYKCTTTSCYDTTTLSYDGILKYDLKMVIIFMVIWEFPNLVEKVRVVECLEYNTKEVKTQGTRSLGSKNGH